MNLLHIFCEHLKQEQPDYELVVEVYNTLIKYEIDQFLKDKLGRIPLHYCYKNGNMFITNKLLANKSHEEKVKILNLQDNDQVTVFGMLFYKISEGNAGNPLNQMVYDIVKEDTKKLNPFVRFKKEFFPYTQLSYSLEEGEMIHPLILLYDVNKVLPPFMEECFDFMNIGSADKGFSLMCQLFKLGRVTLMSYPIFRSTIEKYLEIDGILEFIQKTLSQVNSFGAFQNNKRISRFLQTQFNVALEIAEENDEEHTYGLVK